VITQNVPGVLSRHRSFVVSLVKLHRLRSQKGENGDDQLKGITSGVSLP